MCLMLFRFVLRLKSFNESRAATKRNDHFIAAATRGFSAQLLRLLEVAAHLHLPMDLRKQADRSEHFIPGRQASAADGKLRKL